MSKLLDLTGKRFGNLRVISRVADRVSASGAKTPMWECQCACGNKIVTTRTALFNGKFSCGCIKRKDIEKEKRKNLRARWHSMKQRCYNPNNPEYKNYGGRGIRVCDEWLNDFDAFADWALANGYRRDLSIDRVYNDGNYEPTNCRWVNNAAQVHNRREYSTRKSTQEYWRKWLSEQCDDV